LDLPRIHSHWPPGQKPLVVNGVVVCPFKEEKEGISIISNVAKWKGEDPTTPGFAKRDRARWYAGDPFRGYVLLGPPLKKPRDRNEYRVNSKTTQHTQ